MPSARALTTNNNKVWVEVEWVEENGHPVAKVLRVENTRDQVATLKVQEDGVGWYELKVPGHRPGLLPITFPFVITVDANNNILTRPELVLNGQWG